MASENRPPSVNRITPTRDSYWFAHGGVDEVTPANARGDNKSTVADVKEVQLQNEREERIRIFREQQEEERIKRLKGLEQSFVLSKKFREQQEEDRRRKIEDARVKEIERRQQVEERKRQIWEAEQERKEAILRRNLEREARIEARRNAQRNSLCFAFGSSTPRTFDLDLAALGNGRNSAQGFSLMTAISGRQSEERDFGTKRATSSCSLDRKSGEDCMSRSMVSLSSVSRGRRRTDLIPTVPRERSATPHSVPRGNPSMRAVSMTRLDQLAQPRRRYYEAVRDGSPMANATTTGPRTVSPSMSKSMFNLSNSIVASQPPKKLICAPTMRRGNMSRSMLHLPESSQQHSPRLTPSPTSPPFYGKPLLTLRSAQSMTHLAIAPPRLTRAARLRADALANARKNGQTTSLLNLCKTDSHATGRLMLSAKDSSRSPSRPQSSMSGRSEISVTSSQASAVSLRPKPAPRRPCPFSIAGTTLDRSNITTSLEANKLQDRQPRPYERNVNTISKPPRAKSVDPENVIKTAKPMPPPRKPVPPPKTAEILAKAKAHPVPTKDNLRKQVIKTPNGMTKDKLPGGPNLLPSSDEKSVPLIKPVVTSPESTVASSPESEPTPLIELEVVKVNKSTIGPVVESVALKNPDVVPTHEIGAVEDAIIFETEPSSVEKKPEVEILSQDTVVKQSNSSEELTPSKPRITSEEEARAALAEKRKLAREQAEKEAELERQRQEEIRLQEEERRRQEELEQKRMEEEQIRLVELHRKLEEEKLKKAIEEQQQREKEEKERQEEEARLKAEKDEQDKKAREEAERQRIELEERLRKEEEERAERKRRVEQIMSRTRSKGTQPGSNSMTNSKSVSPVEDTKTVTSVSKVFGLPTSAPEVSQANGLKSISNNNISLESKSDFNAPVTSSTVKENSNIFGVTTNISNAVPLLDSSDSKVLHSESAKLLDLDISGSSTMKNGFLEDKADLVSKTNVSNVYISNRTLNADKTSPMQTNGYSSHEETSCTSSPEEKSEKTDSSEGLLLDFDSHHSVNVVPNERTGLQQLIDIGGAQPSTNLNNDNFLMNVDVVNSNLVSSGNPFIGFEGNLPKKQETTISDLLL